jgi:amino acid transporter
MQPDNNLNVFRILFLIKGILTLVFSLFFVAYAAFGTVFMNMEEFSHHGSSPDFNPGYIFMIFGAIGFIICIVMGILQLMASKYIKELRKRDFIMVVAILGCLTGILGILLGIFTIIELQKPNVRALFEKSQIS